jgi:DNA-binding XRE family transcriptional regulator
LGEHLRLARIDRGLKQTELAQVLGVVDQTVENWEHNLVPTPKSRARACRQVGGSADRIVLWPMRRLNLRLLPSGQDSVFIENWQDLIPRMAFNGRDR